MVIMEYEEDRQQLAQATELLRSVIERHRNEDLRAISIFSSAIQEIRVGQRYLGTDASPTPGALR